MFCDVTWMAPLKGLVLCNPVVGDGRIQNDVKKFWTPLWELGKKVLPPQIKNENFLTPSYGKFGKNVAPFPTFSDFMNDFLNPLHIFSAIYIFAISPWHNFYPHFQFFHL